eukprot:SAG31_NODE_3015_length_4786_cov_2.418818_3_plen_870_part_00
MLAQTLEGNWSAGVGMGMISSDDGTVVFEGEWRQGIPYKGKGAWRDTDEKVYEGEWRNGILYGKDLSRVGLRVGNDLASMEVGTDAEDTGSVSASDDDQTDVATSKVQDSTRKQIITAQVQSQIKPKAGHRLVTGRQFEGQWRNSAPWSGLGMWRGRMAHVFDGMWRDGRPHEGKGAWMSQEGWVFDGELRNGRVVVGAGKWRDVMELQYPPDPALVSADGRVFEGEWRDGVPYNGKGLWWDGHNHIYDGEWGALEGRGRIIICPIPDVTDGGIFEGKWRGGLPLSGSGMWTDLDGYVYEGEWRDAMPQTGQGEWNYAGNVYNGRWEDGKGAGRVTGAEGGRYKGSWRGWRPWIGQGEFTDPEGHTFTGDYKDGAPYSGTGTWKSDGGHVYRGDLKAGQPWTGEGSFKDVHRDCVYEGMWTNGEGEGNIYGSGEEVFRGEWKNEVPWTGRGSWRNKHGKVLEGEWEQGEGAGMIVGLERGEVFEGAWADGDGAPTTGTGSWYSEDGYGNLFKGKVWKDSKGTGTITNPNGRKFHGTWWNLVPYNGKGVYRGPDGFDFEGQWKDGVRIWRGRKWKDSEVTGESFYIRMSRFTMGRQSPAERAAAAKANATGMAVEEKRKTAMESLAEAKQIAADRASLSDGGQSPTSRWVAEHAISDNLTADVTKGQHRRPRIQATGGGLQAGAAIQHVDSDLEEAAMEDEARGKLDALKAALDCGALSQRDYARAKKRVVKDAAGESTASSDSEVGEDDGNSSEDEETKRLRAVSHKGRRTANPWSQDMDYIPSMTGPLPEEATKNDDDDDRNSEASASTGASSSGSSNASSQSKVGLGATKHELLALASNSRRERSTSFKEDALQDQVCTLAKLLCLP